MLRVKICGLKTLEDALAAVEAGAKMLGFNFYPPSPRYLSPGDCSSLIAGLRDQLADAGVKTVGVFVNTPPERVRAILETLPLDMAQLSGDEAPMDLERIGTGIAFKALRTNGKLSLLQAVAGYPVRQTAPAFLVDAGVPGQYGGTGQTADWEQACMLAQRMPLLLAGGLHPGNVAAAVRKVRPWGVDVASGVESAPGVKDKDKMNRFIEESHRAAQEDWRWT
jgi:phosphoribosylanthranilate isomerase